ncbi:hypothetical protein IAT38_003282 [Cryptococcus sp. DSM 104549]
MPSIAPQGSCFLPTSLLPCPVKSFVMFGSAVSPGDCLPFSADRTAYFTPVISHSFPSLVVVLALSPTSSP